MIRIRPMNEADVPQVSKMEAAYFSEPWSSKALTEVVANEQAIYMVAEDTEHDIVGYCGMYCILGEGDINQVAVKEDYRGAGVGKKLLQDFMQFGKEQGINSYTLEVRVGNSAAIKLYEKCGFKIEATRKNFYNKPVEDAYIMWKR